MNMEYSAERMRLQRALGSAEYRECSTDKEKLRCLLFTFSIKPHAIIKETHFTRHQVYYCKQKNGDVRERAGRPSVLEGGELDTVTDDMRRRAEMMRPVTRRELVEIVRL